MSLKTTLQTTEEGGYRTQISCPRVSGVGSWSPPCTNSCLPTQSQIKKGCIRDVMPLWVGSKGNCVSLSQRLPLPNPQKLKLPYIATGDLEDGIKLRIMMEKAQPMLTKWPQLTPRILQSRDLPCCSQKEISKGRRAERCKVAGFEDGGRAMNCCRTGPEVLEKDAGIILAQESPEDPASSTPSI